jgi:hypothetical protein
MQEIERDPFIEAAEAELSRREGLAGLDPNDPIAQEAKSRGISVEPTNVIGTFGTRGTAAALGLPVDSANLVGTLGREAITKTIPDVLGAPVDLLTGEGQPREIFDAGGNMVRQGLSAIGLEDELDAANEFLGLGGTREPSSPIGGSEFFKENLGQPIGDIEAAGSQFLQDVLNEIPGKPGNILFGEEGLRGGSKDIRSLLGDDRPFESLSEADKIAATTGEFVGGSLPFAAMPFAAIRKGITGPVSGLPRRAPGRPSGITAPIIESAEAAPGKFASAELGSAVGAGTLAGYAEAVFPGNESAKTGGAIVGGLLNPFGLVNRLASGTFRSGKTALQSMTRAGRERRAADTLQGWLVESGENIDDVAAALLRADEVSTELSSGFRANSRALIDIEKRIAADDVFYSDRSAKNIERAFEDLDRQITALGSTGRPEDLAMAARARETYFEDLLSSRISSAERKVAEAYARVGTSSTGNRAAAGVEAKRIMKGALDEARKVEDELWNQVPKDVGLSATKTRESVLSLRDDILDEESLPLARTLARVTGKKSLLEAMLEAIDAGGVTPRDALIMALKGFDTVIAPTTSGEMVKVRSRLLKIARTSTDGNTARIAGDLAEAVRLDLDTLGLPVIRKASDYTRLKHDMFSRTFAGDAVKKGRSGAANIAPEMLLEAAFTGKGTQRALRFQQMFEAAGFADSSRLLLGDTPGSMFSGSVRGAQEAFLRDNAASLVTNGVMDPGKVQRFLQANDEVLSQFPALKADLQNGEAAANLLKKVTARSVASKAIQQKTSFGRIANTEAPSRVISDVLSGANPKRQYSDLARLAKKSGPGATAGLKVSTLDVYIDGARGKNGMDFGKLKNDLFNKTRDRPSVISIMRENGVMKPTDISRLERMINRGIEIEDAVKAGRPVSKIVEDADMFTDLVVRLVSVRLVSDVNPLAAQGPGRLIQAQAASGFGRKLLEKIPQTRVKDVIIEASENPRFMAALLRKPKSLKQARHIERQINSGLLSAGIIAATPEE